MLVKLSIATIDIHNHYSKFIDPNIIIFFDRFYLLILFPTYIYVQYEL